MPTRYYRLTVIGCALAWFMVGLHLPALHQMTHHGRTPDGHVLGMMALLGLAGIAALWALLRAPVARPAPSDTGASTV